jgi:hypothetical protein
MKDSFSSCYKSVMDSLYEHRTSFFRIAGIVIFFLLPFSTLIPLQGIPTPELRLVITPYGYPIDGNSWDIISWGSANSGVNWNIAANTNISITTQNEGTFQLVSDTDGKASFQYFKKMGTVVFSAFHEDYGAYGWVPQESFVDNTLSLFVIGTFGIGTFSGIWEILSRNKRKNIFEKTLYYPLLVTSIIGVTLSLLWFMKWKLGTQWGFGNTILFLGDYRINFDPHLLAILVIVLILAVLNLILANNLFQKSHEKPKKADYVV